MSSLYFIILFGILISVALSFTVNKKKESFQNKEVVFHQPESPVVQKNLNDTLQAYTYPSDTLLSPSPGQIASFNSLPYIDPSLEKAKYERILNVQTTLQGFLDNEAKSLSDLSDPSIVLPLTTARGDLVRLRNEVMVLQRNPGIDSSLTQNDVDEIEANLVYLQKKWRLSIYNDINNIENFTVEGFESSDRASLNQLNSLISKIDTTTTLLSSSGTNDPVFSARIQALNNLKIRIQGIVREVESGSRPESEIPITQSAYENFLKNINNNDSPISNLMTSSGLPPTLSDLFPAYSYGDVSGANLAKYLFNKYADTLFKGLSWNLNIQYTSESEQELARNILNSVQQPPQATLSPVSISKDNKLSTISPITDTSSDSSNNKVPTNQEIQDNRGEFSSTITDLMNRGNKQTKPQKFDWHEKANYICDAIQKRGLNPDDFGCLKPDQYVSENFSWRGYARMICHRLGTSYDTGLPESCGCPPLTWGGWRS